MLFSKVLSSEIGELSRRIVKVLVMGLSDVRTGRQAAPAGIDSSPVKDMVAIYSSTSVKGKAVVIGYLNVKQLADIGEIRLYSTDSDGELKMYVWCKNDGTLELGGNAGNAVRFQELETGFNKLRDDFNELVQKYNAHVHSGVQTGPGSSAVTATTAHQSTASIAGAKIEEIKTL